MHRMYCGFLGVVSLLLSGCVSTSMQGYADRDLPARPVQHIVAYVAAPGPLAASMQSSIAEEARKRGILAEDALTILPPTRTYTDAEVRKALAERGVDGVLVITVADSGVRSQYDGTIFQATYSGSSAVGSATPTYRYSRRTSFSARLVEPSSARNLWAGTGEVNAGGGGGLIGGLIGRAVVADGISSSNSISAIFEDLQKKGLIGTGGAS